jgi:hypothetical protein
VSLSLPYDTTLDGGVNASHVQSNFTTIANKFGALTAADMPSLILPSSQLTASNVELIIPLRYEFSTAATTGLKALCPLPGTGAYTIQSITYAIFNPAAATPTTSVALTGGTPASGNTFVIEAGTLTLGAWVVTNTPLASTQFYTTATGAITSGTVAISAEQAPISLGLRVTAVNTPPTSGAIHVSVRLTRGLQ